MSSPTFPPPTRQANAEGGLLLTVSHDHPQEEPKAGRSQWAAAVRACQEGELSSQWAPIS